MNRLDEHGERRISLEEYLNKGSKVEVEQKAKRLAEVVELPKRSKYGLHPLARWWGR